MLYEKPETIALVTAARNGDDAAFEKLYHKYYDLISGRKMMSMLGQDPTSAFVNEDLKSLCQLLFVEAIHKYDPEKSGLTTFITNYIRWQFLTHHLSERLIRVVRQNDQSKTRDFIDKTNVTLIDGREFNRTLGNRMNKAFELRLSGDDHIPPMLVESDSLIPAIMGFVNNFNTTEQEIYNSYLENMVIKDLSHVNAMKKVATKHALSYKKTEKIVSTINKFIKETMSISPTFTIFNGGKKHVTDPSTRNEE